MLEINVAPQNSLRWKFVKPGMMPAQVLAILGQPDLDTQYPSTNEVVWYYGFGYTGCVFFQHGKVCGVNFH